MWKCLCDCSNHAVVRAGHLLQGKTRSCGCLALDKVKGNTYNLKHGQAKVQQGPVYRTWVRCRSYCSDPNNPSYHIYGGKGIRCLWDSFEQFYDDIGREYPRPGHRLKRIDNELDFGPDTCFWQPIGTGVKGVNYHKRSRKFVARVRIDGKLTHLGEYKSKQKAIEVVREYGA
jgi:hypothetical protein